MHAIDEAEETANALIESTSRTMNRSEKILVLTLLALVASDRALPPATSKYLSSTYRELWFAHTPNEERSERAYSPRNVPVILAETYH